MFKICAAIFKEKAEKAPKSFSGYFGELVVFVFAARKGADLMIIKIKMWILEQKIRRYGRSLEEYRLKEMKYQYYVNKVKEYTNKISEVQNQYQQLMNKGES